MTLDTVARFKGLEAEIVLLWGLDQLNAAEEKETLYVGASRAKSLLVLCGPEEICRSMLSAVD